MGEQLSSVSACLLLCCEPPEQISDLIKMVVMSEINWELWIVCGFNLGHGCLQAIA
jgi:hypothetical protein